MTKPDRELLRPEDASSWEEFQARCTAEQARCVSVNSSWGAIGQTLLASVVAFGAILLWGGMALGHGPGKWLLLVLAVGCTWLFGRLFVGRVMRRGVRGARRYTELSRLWKQWQARAERGEIPLSTPGGPKVWRDQVEAQAGGT